MLDDSQKDKKQMRMPINELKKLHDSLKALSVGRTHGTIQAKTRPCRRNCASR